MPEWPGARRWWWLLSLILGLAIALLARQGFQQWLDQPMRIDQQRVIDWGSGGTLSGLANRLADDGILRHPRLLTLHGRLQGDAGRLHAGEYRLQDGLTPRSLYGMLQRGEVVEYQLTLVEGWTLAEVRDELRGHEKLQHTLRDVSTGGLLQELGLTIEADSPEGLFFPDTYSFRRGSSDRDLLRQAHRRLRLVLDEEWGGRDQGLPYGDSYQALVMASLIEKETGVEAERAEIAGVFVRRLQSNMRLQTDPSVIYGLGSGFDGNLRRRHLREPGPYNTYMNAGLPPTPIALAGRAAIRAALQPAPGTALYFVARGDGSHQFSDDLAEHQAAVRRFQVDGRAENYRSHPPTAGQEAGE